MLCASCCSGNALIVVKVAGDYFESREPLCPVNKTLLLPHPNYFPSLWSTKYPTRGTVEMGIPDTTPFQGLAEFCQLPREVWFFHHYCQERKPPNIIVYSNLTYCLFQFNKDGTWWKTKLLKQFGLPFHTFFWQMVICKENM